MCGALAKDDSSGTVAVPPPNIRLAHVTSGDGWGGARPAGHGLGLAKTLAWCAGSRGPWASRLSSISSEWLQLPDIEPAIARTCRTKR